MTMLTVALALCLAMAACRQDSGTVPTPFRYAGCRPVSFRDRNRRPTAQHAWRGDPTDSHDYANPGQPSPYAGGSQRSSRRTYCYSHPYAGRCQSYTYAAGSRKRSRPIYSHCYTAYCWPNSHAAGDQNSRAAG